MIYLYVSLVIFVAFIILQTLYILIPLFKNEGKNRKEHVKDYSFSILVPAYNEEKVIEHCLIGFQQSTYDYAELIIINDGSSDNTLPILIDRLNLAPYRGGVYLKEIKHKEIKMIYKSESHPNIFVIDKIQGGKADALNAGINFSINEIIITLDADSILDKSALAELNKTFQDKSVVACGGNVMVAQGFHGVFNQLTPTFKMSNLIRYQFLQYLTAFFLHKQTQASLKTISVIAGAFGAFRKDVLLSVQGFRNTIGEDMDITLKFHLWIGNNKGKRIEFNPTAKCYTECPTTLYDLFKQRVRWQKAFIDCLLYYRKSFFTKFSKRFSLYFLIDQFIIGTLNAFPILAIPIIFLFYNGSAILIILFGISAVLLFSYQTITTIYVSTQHGIRFSKMDIVRILLFLPIEIFVFRLIVNLLFVVYGTVTYFYQSQSWNKIERSGQFSSGKEAEG